jgi:DNA-binding transcriptional LysR family regulator
MPDATTAPTAARDVASRGREDAELTTTQLPSAVQQRAPGLFPRHDDPGNARPPVRCRWAGDGHHGRRRQSWRHHRASRPVVPDPSPLTEGRDFGVLSPGTWRVSDNATKHALILAGVGWGSLPLWLVERDLAEGRLVRVAAAEFGPGGETFVRAYLAHRTDEPLAPAARAFRHALLRRTDGAAANDKSGVTRRRQTRRGTARAR